MWVNVILVTLISSQCILGSLWYVGWSQGLALQCACIWALVTKPAVVCSNDLCGSLPWTYHCFGHHNLFVVCLLSWAFWITTLVAYFTNSVPSPPKKWFAVATGSGKFLHWSSFSAMVLVGGHLQGWYPLIGPPTTFDSISSQAQLAMSLKKCKAAPFASYS